MIPFIETLPEWVQTYGTVAASSLGASAYYWYTQRAGVENPEPFKLEKAGVTMGVAFALSLVLYGTGTVTGSEQLLAHLSIGVGPIALWAQKGIQQYQRTGEINITNGSVDEAAEAFADALGISASDLFALADLATAAPVDPAAVETSTPSIESPERPEERDHPDAPAPTEPDAPRPSAPGEAELLDARAKTHIQEADHRTLQKVGGQLEGVDGSGHDPMPLAEQLRQIDPEAVLAAFDSIESTDSVGEGAFQLRE